jgi:molybdate transport system substrate-binding protein
MRVLVLAVLAVSLAAAPPARAAEVNVSAAASLTEALKEIASGWERATGNKVVFNFGASSLLARQIQEAAPADLFFSADDAKMDVLQEAGLLVPGTRRTLLSNSLVVVVASDASFVLASMKELAAPRFARIAVAEPQTVPAGIYAREYLRKIGLWSRVVDRLIPTENVRGALAAVESGNVDAAIVYKTDAMISRKVKVAFEVPREEGPDISYPVALVAGAEKKEAAKALLDHLASGAAKAVFVRYGFVVGSPRP